MCTFVIRGLPGKIDSTPLLTRNTVWTARDWRRYDRRKGIGDIISVHKDGIRVGKLVTPPAFVFIDVDGMSVHDGQVYTAPLISSKFHILDFAENEVEEEQTIVRNCMYSIPESLVNRILNERGVIAMRQGAFESALIMQTEKRS
jgi:hypothetical protein